MEQIYNHLILNVKNCRNIGVLVERHTPDLYHMMMAMSFAGLAVLTVNLACRLRFNVKQQSKYKKLRF